MSGLSDISSKERIGLEYPFGAPQMNRYSLCITAEDDSFDFSSKFRWLPSIFHVHDDGSAEIKTYVNGLPVESNRKLYKYIEKIFLAIPGFEKVLGSIMCSPRGDRKRISDVL